MKRTGTAIAKKAPTRLGHPDFIPSARKPSNDGLIRILDRWMADKSGYDEKVWPALKSAIEEHRLSRRKHFRG